MFRKVLMTTLDSIAAVGLFGGVGGLAGAVENGSSLIIPFIMLVASALIVMLERKIDEIKIHDCTNNKRGVRTEYMR